jgi:hypothetical protein
MIRPAENGYLPWPMWGMGWRGRANLGGRA